MNEDLIFEILAVVNEIPYGTVATYGQIARLIGRDKNSRLVGRVLSVAGQYGDFPCHRVVNSVGRLVPGWIDQEYLLKEEKITFKNNGNVDLKKHQWKLK